MRRRPVALAVASAIGLAAVAPLAAQAATACPTGRVVARAEPRLASPEVGDLAQRGNVGVVFRQTKGGRLVVCEDRAKPSADRRDLRVVATAGRVGRRDRVVVAAVEGRSRIAWWVDRPGTADRIYERAVGRRATRVRSVAATLTPSSIEGRTKPETVLSVGSDGTLAWVRRTRNQRSLMRARPGQRTRVAARWTRDPLDDHEVDRWDTDALLVPSPTDEIGQVVALDAGGGRCPDRPVIVQAAGRRLVAAPTSMAHSRNEESSAFRPLALCDAQESIVRLVDGAGSSENGGGGSGLETSSREPTRAVLLGDAILVEQTRRSSGMGQSEQRLMTSISVLGTRAALPGAESWMQLPGETTPPASYGLPPTSPQTGNPLLVNGGVAAWRAVTGTPRREELHVIDADGHRVAYQALANTGGEPTDLRIEGSAVRFRVAGEERAVSTRPGAPAVDSGRRPSLIPYP